MELNLFNKINRTIQFVNESFTSFERNYGEFDSSYIGYNRTLVENQPHAFDVLQQFQDVTVRQLFKRLHLQSGNYGDNYLNLQVSRFTEARVGVHYEFPYFLFYYLVNSLEVEIRNFLHLVRSEEFRRDLPVDIILTEGVLRYSFDRHNIISDYIRERIPLYNRLFNLLNQSTKVFLAINSDRPYFEIELEKLDRLLEVSNSVYQFDVIEII
jgi:hypothetical protein